MDMIQDWMIINKIKMGDPDAWDILVHKYYDSVYFYCVRRCYGVQIMLKRNASSATAELLFHF